MFFLALELILFKLFKNSIDNILVRNLLSIALLAYILKEYYIPLVVHLVINLSLALFIVVGFLVGPLY